MFIYLLFTTTYAIKGSYQCLCSELGQVDCSIASGCDWSNDICNSITPDAPTCKNYEKQYECDAIVGCAWTNNGICGKFTQCSNYIISSGENGAQCYMKDDSCIPGQAVNGKVPCTTGTMSCTDVTDSVVCPGLFQSDGQECWWTTSCVAQGVAWCSTILLESLCLNQGCVFTNQSCYPPMCSNLTQDKCIFVRGDSQGSTLICKWNGTTCNEANDLSYLNATTCYSNTGGTYQWNNGVCTQCYGGNTNYSIMMYFYFVLIILIN